MKVKAIVTDPDLHSFGMPKFATPGSAAVDLRAMFKSAALTIMPGKHERVPTGLKIWVEDSGYAGVVLPRSGLGSNGLVLGNLTGLIDSDYQGDMSLTLWNRTNKPIVVQRGDRVAQFLVIPVVQFDLDVVDDFGVNTVRGNEGFGSTGAA